MCWGLKQATLGRHDAGGGGMLRALGGSELTFEVLSPAGCALSAAALLQTTSSHYDGHRSGVWLGSVRQPRLRRLSGPAAHGSPLECHWRQVLPRGSGPRASRPADGERRQLLSPPSFTAGFSDCHSAREHANLRRSDLSEKLSGCQVAPSCSLCRRPMSHCCPAGACR